MRSDCVVQSKNRCHERLELESYQNYQESAAKENWLLHFMRLLAKKKTRMLEFQSRVNFWLKRIASR